MLFGRYFSLFDAKKKRDLVQENRIKISQSDKATCGERQMVGWLLNYKKQMHSFESMERLGE